MRTRPPTRALVWSGFGALVGLWISFAVVAGMTQSTAPRHAAHARPLPKAAPVGLALSAAPALHVRPAVFGSAPAVVVAAPRPTHHHRAAPKPAAPAPATTAPLSTAPQTPITSPVTPTTTAAPTIPAQQAPAPQPARKAHPTLVAKPKPSSGGGFDESAPSGFDNSG